MLIAALTFTTISVLPQTVTTANAGTSGSIDVTWTYADGSSMRLEGTVTSWDESGPHGVGIVTITIPGEGSWSFYVTFSDDGTNSNNSNGRRVLREHPEINNSIQLWLDSQSQSQS